MTLLDIVALFLMSVSIQIEKDEKGKFSIVRHGQVPIKLRADSAQESDEWIARMSTATQQVFEYFDSWIIPNTSIYPRELYYSLSGA